MVKESCEHEHEHIETFRGNRFRPFRICSSFCVYLFDVKRFQRKRTFDDAVRSSTENVLSKKNVGSFKGRAKSI